MFGYLKKKKKGLFSLNRFSYKILKTYALNVDKINELYMVKN